MQSLLFAISYNRGYKLFLSDHQSNGFSCLLSNGSAKYLSSSIISAAVELLPPIMLTMDLSNSSQISLFEAGIDIGVVGGRVGCSVLKVRIFLCNSFIAALHLSSLINPCF